VSSSHFGVLVLVIGLAAGASLAQEAVGQETGGRRQRGMELAAAGDVERAYELLASWFDEHPDDSEATTVLALVAAEIGRLDEAEALLARLPAEDLRLAVLGADIALQRGHPRVAISRLAARWPERSAALDREFKRILGRSYVETGQFEQALEVLAGVSSDPLLILWRSRALFQTGRMEAALAALQPLAAQIDRGGVNNAPASQRFLISEVLTDTARSLLALGRSAEAVALLEPNVELLASRRAWNILAQALVGAGRGDEARSVLDRGAAQVPKE